MGRTLISFVVLIRAAALIPLVGAITAAYSQNPKFEFHSSSLIDGFPSASAVICYGDKLFVMGDDSRQVMILDEDLKKVDSIKIFEGQGRVPQDKKADIESAIRLRRKILLIGSASSQVRQKSYLIKTGRAGRDKMKILDNRTWLSQSDSAAGPINIEGAFVFKGKLIAANRAMKGDNANMLFVTPLKPFLRGRSAKTTLYQISLPDSVNTLAGISDLFYRKEEDVLLITLSSEDSNNPLEDGAIGKSYLGWISRFSASFKGGALRLDGMVDLTSLSSAFEGQKIEGVCAKHDGNDSLILHFVSDNDDGVSRIFSVRMTRL